MLGSRAARASRGVVAAGVATIVAAASHSIADGGPAPALGILLALVVATPVCVALAGRRLSWMRLSLAVALSQFAFHGLLLIGVGATAAGPMPAMAHGMTHGAAAPGVAAAITSTAMPMNHGGAWMWIAHAVAAILTVLAIGRGERALVALLALSGWPLLARLALWAPAPAVRLTLPAVAGRLLAAPAAAILCTVRRRGPPLAA